MLSIPDSIKYQINNPKSDIKQFVDVITGRVGPKKVHLAELFADEEVMRWITEDIFRKTWTPLPADPNNNEQIKQNLLCQIEYWYRMGYDYIRITGGLNFTDETIAAEEPENKLGKKYRKWINIDKGPIQTFDDFEKYPWPDVRDEDFWIYEFVADNLPEGMGLMACPHCGFLEIPTEILIGFESMSMMIYDTPELVKAVFDKVRKLIIDAYRKVVDIPKLAGFFQGDDMGYKTGTMFSPDFLKQHVMPGHKQAAELAHSKGKIYMLHTCGKLDAIIEYLIDEVGIDAKHSYEDIITPVEQFYSSYSDRVGILGGLDVNLLAGSDEANVRKRTKQILNKCSNSRYAFGSGNSITNYCKKQNILAMFDEALSYYSN